MRLRPVTAAISVLVSAATLTACQHAQARQASGGLRLIDSFCAGGLCERVYTRFSDEELRRHFMDERPNRPRFEPYVVKVEPDPAYRLTGR
jgi:hypothetical protein